MNGKSIKDTSRLNNGKFSFSGAISEPTDAAIAGNIGRLELQNPNIVEVFIEPSSMTVQLQYNHFKDLQIEGSATQNESKYVDSLKAGLLHSFSQISRKLRAANTAKDSMKTTGDQGLIKNLRDSLALIQKKVKEIDISFIINHPRSYLSLSTIQDYFLSHDLSIDSAKKFYTDLDKSLKTTKLAFKLTNEIKAREDNNSGISVADFTRQDFNNEQIKLSSFRNKNVVLLEFWATWCLPCLKIKPDIKSIIDKYQSNGLVLIQVSIDAHKENWRKYLNSHKEGGYINLWSPPNSEGDLRPMFDVRAIPALVLIDKNGTVINHYLGEGNNLGLSDLKNDLAKLF